MPKKLNVLNFVENSLYAAYLAVDPIQQECINDRVAREVPGNGLNKRLIND